jgi:outer membrane receptor protein involved in Fe transport
LCSPDAASYSLVDFFTTYHVSDSISVNFGVDNLLNRDPVITGGVLGQTNAGEYDTVGRNYYLGVRANF